MKSFCTFEDINAFSKPGLPAGYDMSLFELDHLIETYGFSLSIGSNENLFSYVADTLWCESIEKILNFFPKIVLIGLNGEEADPKPVIHCAKPGMVIKL